jgi:hypothetical protein
MVMMVSTTLRSSSMPFSARRRFILPSNSKGLLTTATVREPSSRLNSATTGAPPVPVPPPMPAAMKTMSAPCSTCWMRSVSSWAAFLPTSGSPPAPKPRVVVAPNWSFTGARLRSRAWESVLAAMKSTPTIWEVIMSLMALPPAPPMPRTLILADSSLGTN